MLKFKERINAGDLAKLVLADGSQILFEKISDNCSRAIWGVNNVCASILIDVNGVKEPNRFGRDVFYFVLKNNGVYPTGCDNSGSCAASDSGMRCACKVLTENAMNY